MNQVNLDGLQPWGGLAGASFDAADMVVAGIPYDGSAVYRKGAAQAPQRIRTLSAAMPPVTEDGQVLQGLRVHDMGDLNPGPTIAEGWQSVAERLSAVPVTSLLTILGGDHCTAIATIAAQVRRHPDMQLLWVDAHPDLCDFSRGGRWTCGCAMRRALEVTAIDPARVVIAGGRDYDPEEVEFIRATGILLVSARELAADPSGSAQAMVGSGTRGSHRGTPRRRSSSRTSSSRLRLGTVPDARTSSYSIRSTWMAEGRLTRSSRDAPRTSSPF